MAKICAFCGKQLNILMQSYAVIDGSGAELCAACSTRQAILKQAIDANSQEKIDQAILDIKNNSLKPEQAEVHITGILSKMEEKAARKEAEAQKQAEERQKAEEERKKAAEAFLKLQEEIKTKKSSLLTTVGYSFEGYNITQYIGIVSGETVIGTGFLSELSASFADTFGTSSGSFSSKLSLAKNIAFEAAKADCIAKGGNAIIGIDFDYITFSNNMIGVIANGTAVHVEKQLS